MGKKGRKMQRSGHGPLTRRGTYRRSDTGRMAKYSLIRDLKRKAKYLPEPHKPFTGDSRKVWYKIVRTKTGKKKIVIRYRKPKNMKGWKVGWI